MTKPESEDREFNGNEVAIIGMAGRFPGAADIDAFWSNLRVGVESISRFTPDEIEPPSAVARFRSRSFVPAGGVIEDADAMDYELFGISPHEARLMDPQQRAFLECAFAALEDAGYDSQATRARVALYAGAGASRHAQQLLLEAAAEGPAAAFEVMSAAGSDALAMKVSYKLKLRGESLNVNTACSTGLVAVHLACQSLLLQQSDLALAGAARITLPQRTGYFYQDGMIFSPDGHCRAFDHRAQGTVGGSGVAVVVLKLLARAIEEGDHVYAVIKGSALNNDGDLKVGYTAPSVVGQAEVISQALLYAGLDAGAISYVEAHGTGTALGDPIEVVALTRAFRETTTKKRFCALGSVKTNIGHLDVAAGLAGLVKTALALHREELPPSLNFERPGPELELDDSPFFVNTEPRPWRRGAAPRRAGVSSFGIGGTNAHVVLEEAPLLQSKPSPRPLQVLALSARTATALEVMTRKLAEHIERHPELELADVAFTRNLGRKPFEVRRAVVAKDLDELRRLLLGAAPLVRAPREAPKVALLFPGQGAQSAGMAGELFELEPVVRAHVDDCAARLRRRLGVDIRALCSPTPEGAARAAERLSDPRFSLPALFTVESAMAKLWQSLGVEPHAALGHSFGEYVSAYLASVLTLDDALALVCVRGELMSRMPPGAMLAVGLPEAEVSALLTGRLSLAAVNGAERCVVSGPIAEVEALARALAARRIGSVRLPATRAFHSSDVEPTMGALERALREVTLNAPARPYVSSLTGDFIQPEQATSPAYWVEQTRRPVRFAAGLRRLAEAGCRFFVEVGPDQSLTALARPALAGVEGAAVFPTLRGARGRSDYAVMLASLGAAWERGVPVDWSALYRHETRRRVSLPSYPFERKPCSGSGTTGDARADIEQAVVAPRSAVEQRVASIFRDRLGRAEIGAHESFFDLGGDSLGATLVLNRIKDAFRVPLTLRMFFEAPTVAGVAERVGALLEQAAPSVAPPPAPIPREGALPLSFAQERLWFLWRLDPQDPSYLLPAATRLRGALDRGALVRALVEVVRRHEALRTVFTFVEGKPGAVVRAPEELDVVVVSYAELPAAEREGALRRLLMASAREPIDLSSSLPVRARLVEMDAEDHVLVLVMHHIVSDAWTFGVVERELAALYEAFTRGGPSPLPALRVQYADYAAWQRARLSGPVLEQELAYWKERLAGAPHTLDLPTDRPRPKVPTHRGGYRTFALDASLASAIRALARREGATLFMVLLAAFDVLLGRWSGQDDLLVGTPIAGRTHAETEALAGLFVNTLVLRAKLSFELTFRQLVAQVREEALGAFAHQELPFERLVQELAPARGTNRTPLFQVTFALQSASPRASRMGGLEARGAGTELAWARFDLELTMREVDSGMAGLLAFSADVFDRATIDRMIAGLSALLDGIARSEDTRVFELPLLPAGERALASSTNTTAYAETETAWELFHAQAGRTPDRLAAVLPGEALTYAELHRRAVALARRLQSLGVGPERSVGVCLERSFELLVSVVGILAAGGAYVALDPSHPRERLAFMAADAGVCLVLTPERVSGSLEGEAPGGGLRPPGASAGNAAYAIYTSGSTGVPKGVLVEHRGLASLIRWHQHAYGVTSQDRATLLASPGFDASVWEVWPYLTAGAALCLPDDETRASPARLVAWLVEERVTIAFLPTPLAEAAMQETWPAEAALRGMLTGGDQLLKRPRAGLPFRLFNHYGPTEYTVVTTASEVPPSEAQDPPPIGRPIASTSVYILDERMEVVPAGVRGELHVGGVGLARGYLRRPELTAAAFVPDPFGPAPGARLYRTGDRARVLQDGSLAFVERVDHQVKLRGHRIELGEIEAALRQHRAVGACAVVLREDSPGNPRLVAYLVARGETPASRDLAALLGERLPVSMVPSAFVTLDALPLTPSGKVDRRSLPVPDAAAERAHVEPRTPTEAAIAGIWSEVLGRPRVGAQDDFFELGGHSLVAAQAMSRIAAALQVELPLRVLFEARTVEGLAAVVDFVAGGKPSGVVSDEVEEGEI